jgi:hypothetical protein
MYDYNMNCIGEVFLYVQSSLWFIMIVTLRALGHGLKLSDYVKILYTSFLYILEPL